MNKMKSRTALIAIVLIILVVSAFVLTYWLSNQQEPPVKTDNSPQIVVSNPTANSLLSGVVQFNITVIDEESLVPKVYIDGAFRASSNNYTWDTRLEPDGHHTIRVSAEDSSNQTDTKHFQVTTLNVNASYSFTGVFKIMTYNIKESGRNDDWKKIVEQENPDVVILVETGLFDDTSNELLNAATSELNEHFVNETPYDSYTTQGIVYSTSGEAILSRIPIVSFRQVDSVTLDDLSTYYVTHPLIDAVLDVNGTHVHVIGVHLKASEGESNQQRRNWETEGIINYMDSLGNVPILYLGDLNSFAPNDTGPLAPIQDEGLGYGPLTMMLEPDNLTYGQYSSKVHNFTDEFRGLNPDDPGYTFGGQYGEAYMRIDYIIADEFFSGMFLNSTVISGSLANSASDHYAVTAFIQWT
jgi:endonuclease/exonuclease/phosphatase family metal-dependent hydrolase